MDGTANVDTPITELIDRVSQGERLTLVRDGQPVAQLIPPPKPFNPERAKAAMESILARAAANPHPPLSWEEIKAMRDEGRR